jgi:TetR/AcrR family transcriptional regulator, cholesterol catabolism regulator
MSTKSANGSRIGRRRAGAMQNEEYQRRRQNLVHLAAELFHKQGLSETSLGDLARAAKLDRATVYYYFANKEEVFAEVIRDSLVASATELELIASSKGSPAERLKALIRHQMEAFDRHYPFLFVYVRDDVDQLPIPNDLRSEVQAIADRSIALWERVVQEGLDDGTFTTSLSAGITTFTLMGAVAWSHRWYKPGRSLTASTVADGLAQLLVDGLRARRRRRSRGKPRRVGAGRDHP